MLRPRKDKKNSIIGGGDVVGSLALAPGFKRMVGAFLRRQVVARIDLTTLLLNRHFQKGSGLLKRSRVLYIVMERLFPHKYVRLELDVKICTNSRS